MNTNVPFFVSIPHAGEFVPSEALWLKDIPEAVLMCDVDRYVDVLYAPVIEKLGIPAIVGRIHRYVVDLNRLPEDIDERTVAGAGVLASVLPGGFHWYETTRKHRLMKSPLAREAHNHFVEAYYDPFHQLMAETFVALGAGRREVYHLDIHSMPSKAEKVHRDAGQMRPDVVVSDFHGTSCEARFKDVVIQAYEMHGFKVGYNWSYEGGSITQKYGAPRLGRHTIQVELNRALYMNEETRHMYSEFPVMREYITATIEQIHTALAVFAE